MQTFSPFDPHTRAPSKLPPPHACDSQFHVFGPPGKYPIRAGAVYECPDATFAESRKLHRTLGFERAVIVQSTTYGRDHSVMMDALAEGGENYRGCAVIDDSMDDRELQRLHEGGVNGARFNFLKVLNLVPPVDVFNRTIARIAALGWYAKIHVGEGDLRAFADLFRTLRLPVVIDHMGGTGFEHPLEHPDMQLTLDFLRRDNVWMMLSNGDRKSAEGPPWNDAVALARALIATAPDRVVWGTDWPHPIHTGTVPNDADLLELFYRYAPDEAMRQKILVDNPARLFGFTDG